MADNAKTPDKTINYRVYQDGTNLIGLATVDLPEISYMTDTLTGAGVAGELETPVTGHIGAMSLTLNWRTVNPKALALLKVSGATLTLRSAQQEVDNAENALTVQGVKITIKTLPKTVSLGSFEPGASTDTTTELEISYLKIEVDDEEVCEIDKLNFICKFGDTDTLTDVRTALGI